MTSWHRGHPSERRKITTEVPLVPIKSFTLVCSPLTEKMGFAPTACRGSIARALSEGFPEKVVQPQSGMSVDRDKGVLCVLVCRSTGGAKASVASARTAKLRAVIDSLIASLMV